MDRTDPKDRATIARLGGLAMQQRRRLALTERERSEQARQLGEATLAKHGKAHFIRMSLIARGKLPKPTTKKASVRSAGPQAPEGEGND